MVVNGRIAIPAPNGKVNGDDLLLQDFETLCRWVSEESPTEFAAGVNAMASLVQQAASASLASELVPGRSGLGSTLILRGGPRNDKPPAILIGHLDTVHPRGTAKDRNPVRREGDRLYGPGVYDMKAGLLIGLKAIQEVLLQNALSRPVLFFLAPDEEIGSPTSRPVIEDVVRGAAYALVLEPAREDGGCVTSRKGVGRFEISIEGVAAHAGVNHRAGRSAIAEAARQILKIEALTDYSAGIMATVGLVSGGTAINTVPAHCSFSVDFRAPTPTTCEKVADAIEKLESEMVGVTLTKRGGISRPAYERSEGNVRLLRKAQQIASQLGLALQEAPQTGGGSDGNFTAALGIPTLDGLGADGAGAHTLHEYANLATFDKRSQLISGLLRELSD